MISIFLLLEWVISLRIMLASYYKNKQSISPSNSAFNLQEWQLADALGKAVRNKANTARLPVHYQLLQLVG